MLIGGRLDRLYFLVQKISVHNYKNDVKSNISIVMWAASYGHSEVVGVLVDAGADVNSYGTESSMQTPLMLACQNPRGVDSALILETVKVLVDAKGIDINFRVTAEGYGSGYTALDFAKVRDNDDIIATLEAAGGVSGSSL